MTRTIANILDIASDWELAALLAMGMTLPRVLAARAASYAAAKVRPEHLPRVRPTRAEMIDAAIEVIERRKNKTGRPPRRVLSSNGDRWSDAWVAAWALGVKRTTVTNGCGGDRTVRGLELWWEKDAPKWVIRKVLARRRSAA